MVPRVLRPKKEPTSAHALEPTRAAQRMTMGSRRAHASRAYTRDLGIVLCGLATVIVKGPAL